MSFYTDVFNLTQIKRYIYAFRYIVPNDLRFSQVLPNLLFVQLMHTQIALKY